MYLGSVTGGGVCSECYITPRNTGQSGTERKVHFRSFEYNFCIFDSNNVSPVILVIDTIILSYLISYNRGNSCKVGLRK